MPGTTGDIIWRRRDPKTVELYNVVQQPSARPAAEGFTDAERRIYGHPAPAEDILAATGAASTDAERQATVDRDPYAFDRDRKLSATEKKEHKQRLKDFMKYWKSSDPTEFDPTDGIQELFDAGILWHEEDGFGSYANTHMSKKDRDAFVSAADAWGDRVGLWKDGQYDPNAPRTYWENQRANQ